ncbi:MAG: hypothetical protein NC318_07020 [Blautia sp.]|nr:hypothetical protein [Lachnoclostridium sp.]MCM1211337.1 hypothetical protein [Blautia sp.]
MDKRQIDLCRYRLEKAEKCLQSAKLLAQSEDYCSAANRKEHRHFPYPIRLPEIRRQSGL